MLLPMLDNISELTSCYCATATGTCASHGIITQMLQQIVIQETSHRLYAFYFQLCQLKNVNPLEEASDLKTDRMCNYFYACFICLFKNIVILQF